MGHLSLPEWCGRGCGAVFLPMVCNTSSQSLRFVLSVIVAQI